MPLLAPGRHYLSLPEVYERFVRGRRNEADRERLFLGLEELVQQLLRQMIPCEVWLDGSFLTEKEYPSDIDLIIFVDSTVNEKINDEQRNLLYEINLGHVPDRVDAFVYTVYNRGHPSYGTSVDVGYEWGAGYGVENSSYWLKGFVVLRLMETHVGLRICS